MDQHLIRPSLSNSGEIVSRVSDMNNQQLLDNNVETVVIDSGIMPFLDSSSDGGQVIFKGILDQSGNFVLDSSQFAALMGSVNSKELFTSTTSQASDNNMAVKVNPSQNQNVRGSAPIQIQNMALQQETFRIISPYNVGQQTRMAVPSMFLTSSQIQDTMRLPAPTKNQAITLHSTDNPTFVMTSSSNDRTATTFLVNNNNETNNSVTNPEITAESVEIVATHPSISVEVEPPIGKGPFRCQECGKVFLKWPQFKRHRTEHLDEKSFRCSLCSSTFNFEFNLKLHEMIHEAEISGCLECQVCPAKFSRLASLKSHVRVHEKEENLVCPECGDEFATKARLDNHIEEHKVTKSLLHRCRLCGKTFSHAALLKDHAQEHTAVRNQLKILNPRRRKSKVPKSIGHKFDEAKTDWTKAHQRKEKKKKLACLVCSKKFEKPSQLLRHELIHTGEKPFACKQCNRSFNQKGTLDSHILSMHEKLKPYVCHLCNYQFSQRGNLKAHVLKVHVPVGDNEKSYKCEECSCVYRKLASLNSHIAKAHAKKSTSAERPQISEKQSEAETQRIDEITNSKEISSQPELSLNNNPQSSVRFDQLPVSAVPVLQPLCENQVLQNNAAINRNAVVNQPSTDKSSQPHQIITEVKLAHEFNGNSRTSVVKVKKIGPDKWHMCPYNCTKSFRKPSDLIRHIRIHTQERPYVCNVCGKSFAVKSTLNTHLKTHSLQKDWKCRVCQKEFSVLTSLRSHERLHTGAKPFPCVQCGKCFRTSSQRRLHIKAHSRNAEGPTGKRKLLRIGDTDPKIELPDPLKVTSDGLVPVPNRSSQAIIKPNGVHDVKTRPYRCTQCPSAFKKSSHLKQHLRSHSGERPYKCFQCYRSFISSGVLKNHIKTHEGVRAFKCHTCNLTFTTNGSLTRHQATHIEDRAFLCPYCHKSFKTSVACRKHIKTHRSEFVAFHSKVDGGDQIVGNNTVSDGTTLISDNSSSLNQNNHAEFQTHEDVYEDHYDNYSAVQTVSNNVNLEMQNVAEETNPLLVTIPQNNSSNVMVDCMGSSSMQQQIQDITELIERGQHMGNGGEVELQYALPSTNSMEEVDHQISLAEGQGYDGSIFTLQGGDSIDLPVSLSSLLPINSQDNNNGTIIDQPENRSTFEAAIEPANYQLKMPESYSNENCQFSSEKPSEEQHPSEILPDVAEDDLDVKRICESSKTISEQIYNEMTLNDAKQKNKGIPSLPSEIGPNDKYIELDKTKINICEHCGRGFRKRSDMIRHVRIHTGDKPFSCNKCGKRFRVKSTRESHLRTHEGGKTVACHVCNNMFSTKSSLRVHLRLHTGAKPYQCPHCDRSFRTSGHRKAHLVSHFKTPKEPPSSDQKSQKAPPTREIEKPIPANNIVKNTQVLPPVETIKDKSSSILVTNSHSTELDGSTTTTNCFTTHSSAAELLNSASSSSLSDPVHQIIGSLQLTLDGPTVQLQNIQITGLDLNSFQLTDDILQSLGNVIFMTPQNGNDLNNSNLLGVAIQNADGSITHEQLSQQDSLSSRLSSQASSVLTGKDVNVGNTVTNMPSFSQQIQNNNSSTISISDLDALANFDSGTAPILGGNNNNKISDKIDLPSSNNKECQTCGKVFAKPSLLKRHMATHTGEKNFKCKVCNSTFNQKNSLEIHMYTHGNERPFPCTLCAFSSVVKSALKTHYSRAHPTINWNDVDSSISAVSKSSEKA